MFRASKYLTCLAIALASLNAYAADVKVRGYASVVAGQTLDSEDTVYGYENSLNLKNDSLAALQFNAEISDKLSATIQTIARGRDDFEVNMEWAYLTYKFSDSLQLSGGRIRAPFYRYSDFIDVRYAIPWVSAPDTVYGFDFPGYDGFSLVKTNSFGSWDSTVQVVYGELQGELPGSNLEITSEDFSGISWTMVRDWLTLRLGYVTSRSSLPITQYEGLAASVNSVGQASMTDTTALEDNILIEKDRGDFFGAALGIDYNDWLLNAEFVTYAVDDSLLAETDAYYVLVGKRIGLWTPTLTYSNQSGEVSDDIYDNVPAGPIATNFNPVFAQVIAAGETDTDLIIASLRYDFEPGAAIKFEYLDREEISGDSAGLFRIAVDVVF